MEERTTPTNIPVPETANRDQAELADLAAQVLARLDRPIVLVGMMGVGKSSLGRRLAALLGVGFVDADEEIEKAAQRSIPEIFAQFGEAYFRDGERRVIARLMGVQVLPPELAPELGAGLAGKSPGAAGQVALDLVVPVHDGVKVLATGGGAFVNDATRALILERGVAVWLDADLDTLVERTARKDNRPLLKTGDPRQILGDLRASRAPFYGQAPIKVMSGNMPHAKTLARLLQQVDTWLDAQGADQDHQQG